MKESFTKHQNVNTFPLTFLYYQGVCLAENPRAYEPSCP